MQEEIFEKYPIPKAYFKLALPVVFSMVISLVYNMVDTYFIAGTGNTDLVAGLPLITDLYPDDRAGRYFRTWRQFFYFQAFGEKDTRTQSGSAYSAFMARSSAVLQLRLY